MYSPPDGKQLLDVVDVSNDRGRAKPLPTIEYSPQVSLEEAHECQRMTNQWMITCQKFLSESNILGTVPIWRRKMYSVCVLN